MAIAEIELGMISYKEIIFDFMLMDWFLVRKRKFLNGWSIFRSLVSFDNGRTPFRSVRAWSGFQSVSREATTKEGSCSSQVIAIVVVAQLDHMLDWIPHGVQYRKRRKAC
jgi:hypothetical protein